MIISNVTVSLQGQVVDMIKEIRSKSLSCCLTGCDWALAPDQIHIGNPSKFLTYLATHIRLSNSFPISLSHEETCDNRNENKGKPDKYEIMLLSIKGEFFSFKEYQRKYQLLWPLSVQDRLNMEFYISLPLCNDEPHNSMVHVFAHLLGACEVSFREYQNTYF